MKVGQRDKKMIRKELETKDIPASLIEAIVEEEEEEVEEAEYETSADETEENNEVVTSDEAEE
jgi:hypothetical protein